MLVMSSDTKGITKIADSGSDQFHVRIKIKSKTDPNVSVQRESKIGIQTFAQAVKIRDGFTDEALRELARREFLGSTFGQIVEDWEAGIHTGKIFSAKSISRTTLEDYGMALRNHVYDWWKRPASEIKQAEVARRLYSVHTDKGLSRAVQLKIRSAINVIYDWAIMAERVHGISHSPAKDVPIIGRKLEKQKPILNLQQIKKLLEAAKLYDHAWYPIWLFTLHTGVRNGEAYAIEWSDVDLENRRLFISKSYNKRQNKVGPTKSGCWREVPVNDELYRHLLELRGKNLEGSKYILPRIGSWTRGQQATVLREFCKLIGLPEVNFHALRACFATQLLRNGVEAVRVMKICGWRKLETMQIYIRLAGVDTEGVTDTLKFTTADEAMAKVVNLFGNKN